MAASKRLGFGLEAVIGCFLFYTTVQLCFAGLLLWTLSCFPLLWPRLDDAEWLSHWLLVSIGNFYLGVLCLCGVFLLKEDQLLLGVLWCLGVLIAGAPVACTYIVLKCAFLHSLALSASIDAKAPWGFRMRVASMVLYSFLGLAFTVCLIWTAVLYPLVPSSSVGADWALHWLMMVQANYIIVSLCLASMVAATEKSWLWATMWCVGVILAAPCACAYLIHRSLAIVAAHTTYEKVPAAALLLPTRTPMAPRCWEVVIDTRKGKGLGLEVSKEGQTTLVVKKVNKGAIDDWNHSHKDQPVLPGDHIVAVNGQAGDMDVLVAECKKKQLLKLKLRSQAGLRGPTRKPLAHSDMRNMAPPEVPDEEDDEEPKDMEAGASRDLAVIAGDSAPSPVREPVQQAAVQTGQQRTNSRELVRVTKNNNEQGDQTKCCVLQ